MLEQVAESLSQLFGQEVHITDQEILAGGSINQVYRIGLNSGSDYLLKFQSGTIPADTFPIEFEALQLMAMTNTIRVPVPLLCSDEFLVTEYIQQGARASDWQEQLGRNLALMHQQTRQSQFGFHCDNYLGTSLQINSLQDDWLAFWRENRLEPQIKLLGQSLGINDNLIQLASLLMDQLDNYLEAVSEDAVLLHGDLWSGNAMADENGAPVIFDPACYYGHREAEFGMMRLFGGFGASCEAAYAEIWPFAEGYEKRFRLYQLYHELNHLILFGNTYYSASMATLRSLL